MSTTVDQRVVEMRFDNKQFESGVHTTMSTVERLKQSLNLTGATKGLENISSAVKNVNLSGIGAGVEAIQAKFSALQVVGITALTNLTNTAVNAGKRITSALTIDPIKTGFQEYETQINAVQTILANTSHAGTDLNDVNAALDELNTYADKTIYNFTEMTRNIGTFTAAGLGLEESTLAIKGIANLAAVSGSTSAQASTAMYQLSQALANGTVNLQDWNSVVNAGMGGKVFQDALVRTAAAMQGVSEEAFRAKNITGSFRESISSKDGTSWLSAEVLSKTLQQFTGDLSDAELAAMGFTKEQIKNIQEMAVTANEAATKVKTFTQLWDTLKESAQSGWTQTWELLVGDFEEAKEVLTSVSDTIGEIINKSAESRNKLLAGALDSNWEKLVGKINEAGIETETFEGKLKETAKAHKIDVDKLIKEHGSLEEAFRSGAISSDILDEAVKSLSGSIADLSKVERDLKKGLKGDDVKEVQTALKSLGYDLGKAGVDGNFGKMTESAVKAFQEANNLKVTGIIDDKTLKALEEANSKTKNLTSSCKELIDNITELGGREILIQGLKNIFEGIMSVVKPIKEAFREVFPPTTAEQLKGIIESFEEFTSKLKLNDKQSEMLKTTFKGLFSVVSIGVTFVKEIATGIVGLVGKFSGLGNGVLGVASSFGEWLINLRESAEESGILSEAVDGIVGFLGKAIDKIKEFGSALKDGFKVPGLQGFLDLFRSIWDVLSKIGSGIVKAIGNFDIENALGIANTGLFAGVLIGLTKFAKNLNSPFEAITEAFDKVAGKDGVLDNITGILDDVRGCFESFQNQLKAGTLLKIASAIGILTASIFVLSTIDRGALEKSLGAITVLFAELLGSLSIFTKISTDMTGVGKSLAAMIAMSIAITILAGAMKKVSSLDWNGIAKGLVAIGALMAELSIFLNTAKFDGKTTGTAIGIVVLSSAMLILAKAVSNFGSMKWSEIGKGLTAIGGLLAELVIFTKLTGNSKGVVSTGIAMIALGAAMKIFASAMKDFSKMSWEKIGKGLAAMGGALAEVAIATRLMPTNMVSMGVGLIAVGAAMKIVASAFSDFSGMSWTEIGKGLVAMGGALAELAIALNLMNGTLAGSASLIIAAGALAIITPVMATLAKLSWEGIAKGLVALAGAFAVIGVAGLLLTPLIPTLLGLAGSFALFGVATLGIGAGLALIGVGLTSIAAGFTALATAGAAGATAFVASLAIILGGIVDLLPTLILGFGKTISALCAVIIECAPQIANTLLVVIAEVLASLATYTPQIVDSLMVFLIGLLDGLAARMPELIVSAVNLIGSFFQGVADALSGIDTEGLFKGIVGIGLLSGLMLALSAVAALIPGAMVGVLGMGAVIAELALVVAAIGALAQIPGLSWLIEEGGDFLQTLGTAIGQFVGGIVGGIAEGVTASLPQIGTDLSNFMTNLQPFIEGAKGIDSGMMEGVKALTGVILALTAANILESVTSWLTGGSSLSDFAEQLVPFGKSMKKYSEEVSGIDKAAITSSVSAAKSLVAVADSLPSDGIFGTDGIDDFGKNIYSFAKSLKKYADKVAEVDADAINASVTATKGLVSVAKVIPDDGAFGTDGIDDFGKNIYSFAKSLKKYSDKVSDVSISAITSSAVAVTKLVSVINSLVGMDASGVDSFKEAVNSLAKTNVKGVTKAFKNSSSDLKDIGSSIIESLTKGMKSKQTSLTTNATDMTKKMISVFDKQKAAFNARGIELMSRFISGVSSQKARAARTVSSVASNAASGARSSYKSFYNAGAYLATGFANGISANMYKAAAKARAMANAAEKAAKAALDEHSPSRVFYKIGDFAGKGFVNALSDYATVSYRTASEMANSARSGLSDVIGRVTDIFNNDVNTQPSIRPILDLSDVSAGVGRLNSMFGMTPSVGVLSNVGAISSMMNRGQNGGNEDVVYAINKLRKELGNVGGNTYNINGLNYEEGSPVADAFSELIRSIIMQGRI